MSELSVDIKLNQQQAVKAAKDLGSAFDDTATDMEKLVDAGKDLGKSTDDVARDLKRAGDGRPFDEIRRDVERAENSLDDMGDEADDTRKALGKVADAGDDIGDQVGRGTDRAKAGLDDFKSEANQTARESAASFDGSAESIGDVFQEIAANAFGGFGPAGAAAGIAAAAGLGIIISAIQGANEETEKAKERVADWANAFIEAGGTMLTAGVQAARFQAIITDPEAFAEAEKNAKNWGTTTETAVSAMSGNTGAIQDVTRALATQKEEFDAATQRISNYAGANAGLDPELAKQEQSFNDGASALARLTSEMDQGASRAAILNSYYADLINSADGATVQVDELGNSLYTLPDGTEIMVSAETGQATQNVSSFKGDLATIPQAVTSRVNFLADTSVIDREIQRLRNTTIRISGRITATGPGGQIII